VRESFQTEFWRKPESGRDPAVTPVDGTVFKPSFYEHAKHVVSVRSWEIAHREVYSMIEKQRSKFKQHLSDFASFQKNSILIRSRWLMLSV
jgi:hypothetical protein